METPKQKTDYSVVELESLAYRQLVNIEQAHNNLKLINQEIAKRNIPQVDSVPTSTPLPEEPKVTGTKK